MSQRIYPITMPKWGIEMQLGTITEWHVAPGQSVQKGDTMLDVETEKIVNSVEAPVSGVLRQILADKGAVENVGALIAVFADASVSDAEVSEFVRGFKPPNTSFEPDAAPVAEAAEAAVEPRTEPAEESRVSPIARRVASRLGIDISKVTGTGRNGRVSKEDVEAYAARTGAAQPESAPQAAPSADPAESGWARMSPMRATIAKRLLASTQEIPHYRLEVDVDFTALLARRVTLNSSVGKVSVNDLLVRAVALTLMKHPAINSQLRAGEIRQVPQADISIAIATDNGLITPVVRGAELKTAQEIGAQVRDFAERARSNRLAREEITGGSFTISNLGMFGVDRFDAIINPPQVAILAVGAATHRVIAKNGEASIARVATLTLSADHRVVDGAVGAQFLQALRSLLEEPGDL
jgi:pyruvate dehydrogenase E2 component (dihydrolipoamide acetyltransferase)